MRNPDLQTDWKQLGSDKSFKLGASFSYVVCQFYIGVRVEGYNPVLMAAILTVTSVTKQHLLNTKIYSDGNLSTLVKDFDVCYRETPLASAHVSSHKTITQLMEKGDRTRATQERRGDHQSQRDGQQGVRHRIGPGQDAGGLGGRKAQHRGIQRNRSA